MQSVWERLLPTRARTYMLAVTLLMLIHLMLRVYKYRIANTAILTRYTAYIYYVPLMLIPSLFLMTSIYIRYGERGSRRKEPLILVPSAALSFMALTNDLHRFVYIPKVDLAEFSVDAGTYTYGTGFYFLYIWMLVTGLTGVILLILTTRKKSIQGPLMLLTVLLSWVGLALLNELVIGRLDLARPYSGPEIHILGMLGIFEVCIRDRLIPYNENYAGFFQSMQIPALITDLSFGTSFQTVGSLAVNAEDMNALSPKRFIRLRICDSAENPFRLAMYSG